MADVNGASKPAHLASPHTSSQAGPSVPSPTASTQQQSQSQQQQQTQSQSQSQGTATATPPNTQPQLSTSDSSSQQVATQQAPHQAATSLSDPGTSTRPRDARTIHLVLAALGVTAYQERVPLQLLDFAYRYTASVLGDAQHLAAEGYVSGTGSGSGAKGAAATQTGEITLPALRLATAARLGHQFAAQLPKETLLEVAAERNRVRLPDVGKEGVVFGVRLPHERFVMTGTGWGLKEEWDSEVEEEAEADAMAEDGVNGGGTSAKQKESGGEEEQDEDEEMADREAFDEVFGSKEGQEGNEEGMDEG